MYTRLSGEMNRRKLVSTAPGARRMSRSGQGPGQAGVARALEATGVADPGAGGRAGPCAARRRPRTRPPPLLLQRVSESEWASGSWARRCWRFSALAELGHYPFPTCSERRFWENSTDRASSLAHGGDQDRGQHILGKRWVHPARTVRSLKKMSFWKELLAPELRAVRSRSVRQKERTVSADPKVRVPTWLLTNSRKA